MEVSSNAQLDNRISLLVHDITQDNAICFPSKLLKKKKNVSFLIDNQRNTIKVNTKCKIFFLRFENWDILIIQIIIILVYIHLMF